MKKCTICGSENEDAFTSCLICGSPLPEAEPEDTAMEEVEEVEKPKGLSLKMHNDAKPDASQMYSGASVSNQDMQSKMFGRASDVAAMGNNTSYGMNNQMFSSNQAAASRQPQKIEANKKMLLGIWAAIAVVVVGLLFLIVKGGGPSPKAKDGADTPQEVVNVFIEAIDSGNMSNVNKVMPKFIKYDGGVEDVQKEFDEMKEMGLEDMHCTLTFIKSTEMYEGSDLKDLEKDVNRYTDSHVKIEAGCDVYFDYTVSASYQGVSHSVPTSEKITCIKYKGRWYLYD